MSFFIPIRFLLDILFQSRGQVNPGLIRQTDKHPKHIRHFIGQILLLVALFKGLFAINPGDKASHLSYLFR